MGRKECVDGEEGVCGWGGGSVWMGRRECGEEDI